MRILNSLRTLLGHADRMRGHIDALSKDYQEVRCSLVSTLLMQWSMLKESHLTSRSDDTADIDDALLALEGEKKTSNKFVRTKCEHEFVKDALALKRKRDS